jgi:lambda repressor-like predicted transcriptional regulator
LIAYEDEGNMPYISNLERESREAGKVELVIKQLSRRNQLSEETLAKIKGLPIEQLEQLGEDLMDFTGSKDLADWLQRFAGS